jgi:sarcosine oxidase subunit beta
MPQSVDVSRSFDVIVIGAGVMGASISLELARSGRRVHCIDAGPAVGSGSTSSSSAIIRFNYSTFDSVLTAWEAAHRWKDFAGHLGTADPDGMVRLVETGCLALDSPGDNRVEVSAIFRDIGIPFTDLSGEQIKRQFPALDKGDFWPPRPLDDPRFADEPTSDIAGYYTDEGGFIDDPMRAAQNFMFAARCHGAEVRLNALVNTIRSHDGVVQGVTLANGDEVDAPVVVNVAGPAASAINELAGVSDEMRIKSRPLRQEVHVLEAPASFSTETGSLVSDPGLGVYFRPGLSGTVLIGSSEPECDELQWIEDPTDFVNTPTPDVFEAQVLRAARRLPDLRIPLAPVGLADLYDASDDWAPLYDKTSITGYFMACGTSGNQFKNATMVGTFMKALVDAHDGGHDHDRDPVRVTGDVTGREINLAAFSRLRQKTNTTNSVLG